MCFSAKSTSNLSRHNRQTTSFTAFLLKHFLKLMRLFKLLSFCFYFLRLFLLFPLPFFFFFFGATLLTAFTDSNFVVENPKTIWLVTSKWKFCFIFNHFGMLFEQPRLLVGLLLGVTTLIHYVADCIFPFLFLGWYFTFPGLLFMLTLIHYVADCIFPFLFFGWYFTFPGLLVMLMLFVSSIASPNLPCICFPLSYMKAFAGSKYFKNQPKASSRCLYSFHGSSLEIIWQYVICLC